MKYSLKLLAIGSPLSPKKTVYLRLHYSGSKPIDASLKVQVAPEDWNATEGLVTGQTKEVAKINAQLQVYLSKATELVQNEALLGYKISKEKLILNLFGFDSHSSKTDITTLYNIWLESTPIMNSTRKQRNSTLMHLQTFEIKFKKPIDIHTFNGTDLSRFANFLITKGLNQITVLKQIKTTKTFFKWLYESNRTKNNNYSRGYTLKLKSTSESRISLTTSEIQALLTTQYTKPSLYRATRYFIIALSGGLRYSELALITPQTIKEVNKEKYIEIIAPKTGKPTVIYLTPTLAELLLEFDNDLSSIPSNQSYNRLLKEAALEAGLTREVSVFRKGKQIQTKLYNVISSHKVRYTTATLSSEFGIELDTIKEVLNHSTLALTLGYQNRNKLNAAKKLSTVTDKLITKAPVVGDTRTTEFGTEEIFDGSTWNEIQYDIE